jgi:hypothetical protein
LLAVLFIGFAPLSLRSALLDAAPSYSAARRDAASWAAVQAAEPDDDPGQSRYRAL